MTNPKFTPTPWRVHETSIITRQPGKNHKWHIFGPKGGGAIASHDFQYTSEYEPYEDFDEVRANAALIAQSPAMYEFIEKVLNQMDEGRDMHPFLLAEARAILAAINKGGEK
jgi:hypothetical protein